MDNVINKKKFLEFLKFTGDGEVKTFTMEEFEEMEKIRNAYRDKEDISDELPLH